MEIHILSVGNFFFTIEVQIFLNEQMWNREILFCPTVQK